MNKSNSTQGVNKKPVASTLKNMKVDEDAFFPIERMKTVRSTVTEISTIFSKKFMTKQINDQRLIQVTRLT